MSFKEVKEEFLEKEKDSFKPKVAGGTSSVMWVVLLGLMSFSIFMKEGHGLTNNIANSVLYYNVGVYILFLIMLVRLIIKIVKK